MIYFLIFLSGFFLGSVITNILHHKKFVGTLFVDKSDPVYMHLGLVKGIEVEDVCKRRFVLLNVCGTDLHSHK